MSRARRASARAHATFRSVPAAMAASSGTPPSTATRQAILAMAGDEQALADLYVRCREAMLVRAARLMPAWDAAALEDVVADSLLAALRLLRAGRWDAAGGSFLGWLDRVLRNDLVDAARRAKRAPRATDPQQLDALARRAEPGPITRVLADEHERLAVDAVRRALLALPEHYADVLLSRTILGLDVDAAARELGMKRRQVIDATYEARRRLFARLEHGENDWAVFVRHVERRVAVESPAAARLLLRGSLP
jgi:RNA polymerase sigma factor (sigma-70 family)